MNKFFAFIIFICSSATLLFGQEGAKVEDVNQQVVAADSLFIKKLAYVYKTNPTGVLDLLITSKHTMEDIGFGYSDVSSIYKSGYLRIRYQFIFFKDSLISYMLDAGIPYDARLNSRYKKICSPLLKFKDEIHANPIYFNYNAMSQPLSDSVKIASKNKKVRFFMTPFSGVTYGHYIAMNYAGFILLDNRINFDTVKSKLTPEIDYMLLFSKNPATRLCAIEYYYRNPNKFQEGREKFERRIAAIYKEIPIITTWIFGHKTNQYAEEMVKLSLKTTF
jgi:hypothetical protein